MNKFKDFYNNRNGKMILFFSFYLIFFIFLGIFMKNLNNNKKQNETKENDTKIIEKITTYDISNLINNNYKYSITINDNGEEINFNGYKNAIDYANYENKYFFDIYNINQILKRSKFIDSNNLVLSYELNNSELNDILLTKKENGINKIDVTVNEKSEIQKIFMDLSQFMEKNYNVTINYIVGDMNENSPS